MEDTQTIIGLVGMIVISIFFIANLSGIHNKLSSRLLALYCLNIGLCTGFIISIIIR